MRSGRRYKFFSTEEDYEESWVGVVGPSRHLTFVFNTFVLMQLFNMISAGDVEEDFTKKLSLPRLFLKMTKNSLGFFIWLFIFFAQILMVEYGGSLLGCHYEVRRSKSACLRYLITLSVPSCAYGHINSNKCDVFFSGTYVAAVGAKHTNWFRRSAFRAYPAVLPTNHLPFS